MSDKAPYQLLKEALQADYDYAWTFHCQIACAVLDEVGDAVDRNAIAARAMRMLFDIDTSQGPLPAAKENDEVEHGQR